MILSNVDIKQAIATGELVVDGIEDWQIQPASIDLGVDDDVRFPGIASFLVALKPRIVLPNSIAASLYLKSSWIRQGWVLTNGWVDPGFDGQLTVVLTNSWPTEVTVGPSDLFCQLVLYRLQTPTDSPYRGKYQGSTGVVGAK